ncbi:unnamed protein product [Auanema sp. JU1783]|nr:unnamed protein product [Auanema sp. JU1783]
MMVFSHGRIRHMPRQSVLDLDVIGHLHDKEMSSPHSSLGSGPSSSTSSMNTSPNSRKYYNTTLLKNIKMSGQLITSEDVYKLRREMQADFRMQKTSDDSQRCLKESLEVLSELRGELSYQSEPKSEDFPFFVSEYQALVCWIYSEIRFAPYMGELNRHFNNLKNEHRIILSSLRLHSIEHLLALLRFSNICLEYGFYCDEEALDWCREAVLTNEKQKRSSSSISIRCTSSLSSSSNPSTSSSFSPTMDDILQRREEQYRRDIERDLRVNVIEIQVALQEKLERFPLQRPTLEKLV